jgi:hypothetical protein
MSAKEEDIQDLLKSIKDDLDKIQTGKTAWERLESSREFRETWAPERPPQPAQPAKVP